MKQILSILIAVVSLTSGARAITIQTGVGFNPGVNLVTSGGAVVVTSYQFAIGTFAAEPAANASFASLLATFSEFTRATVGASATGGRLIAPGAGGAIAGVSTPETRALFDNKEAYFLVGNGATLEISTEYGLVKGTPIWQFPADTTGASSMNAIAASVAAITPVVGTEIDNATGADSLRLVAVPEPSTGLLAGLVALGLFRRRR